MTVAWTASSSAFATGYVVTRSKSGGALTTVATLPASTTSWDDTAVVLNTTYTYGVSATYLSWMSTTPTATATTAKKC